MSDQQREEEKPISLAQASPTFARMSEMEQIVVRLVCERLKEYLASISEVVERISIFPEEFKETHPHLTRTAMVRVLREGLENGMRRKPPKNEHQVAVVRRALDILQEIAEDPVPP